MADPDDPSADLANVNEAWRQEQRRANGLEHQVMSLRDAVTNLNRAHRQELDRANELYQVVYQLRGRLVDAGGEVNRLRRERDEALAEVERLRAQP